MMKKFVAMAMSLLLTFMISSVAFAEETVVPTTEVIVQAEVTVTVTPEPEGPKQDKVADAEPIVTAEPVVSEQPTSDALQAIDEETATAETETPAVTEEPVTEATATTEPVATEAPIQRDVHIDMNVPANLQIGDTITLTATLIGFEGANVVLQWQYSKDGANWTEEQGATGLNYSFKVTEQNAGTTWRLAVTVL